MPFNNTITRILYDKIDYKASRKISKTEEYAYKHSHNTVTLEVFEAFRKKLGM
jgi:hypothetical protein